MMEENFERQSLSTPSIGILRVPASGVLSPCYNRVFNAEELSVQDFVGLAPQDTLPRYSPSLGIGIEGLSKEPWKYCGSKASAHRMTSDLAASASF